MILKNIAIITGGPGEERAISLLSAESVTKSLGTKNYNLKNYDLPEDLKLLFEDAQNNKIDLAIPIIHGAWGEDGLIPSLLELLKVPYLFSDYLTSALAMDKAKTKKLLATENITMAPGILLNKNDNSKIEEIKLLGWPLVVKPNNSGSSVGVSIVTNEEELAEALAKVFVDRDEVLIEKFIKGRELTVVVTDYQGKAEALPVIEIIPKVSTWFDYEAKYADGGSDEVCPANIASEEAKAIQALAVKTYQVLNCRDLARADFIWDESSKNFIFLEINTVPGLTAASLTPKALATIGLSLGDFFVKLINKKLEIKK